MKIAISKYKLALILIGLIVFANSFFNGFVWDDEEQVLNNTLVHSVTNLPQLFLGSTFNTGGGGGLAGMYYKPMMSVAFASLYTVFGANSFFFHLFQVGLHIANSVMLFTLFGLFFSAPLAFFLALVFLVHPINVETAVYVSALQDTLFMFFGLLALQKLRSLKWSHKTEITVCLLLLFSLLSKETGLLFLPVIVGYAWFFLRKRFNFSLIASASSLAVYLFLRLVVANVPFGHFGPSPILNAPLSVRLLTMPKIAFYYLKTAVFPKDLAIAQHWLVKTADWPNFYLPLIIDLLVAAAILSWLIFIWRKLPKLLPAALFFSGWFAEGMFLHLQIFPLDMTVAERWFYFPFAGLLGILGTVLMQIPVSKKVTKVLTALAVVLILLLSARTIVRNSNWQNGLTLYGHDIKISQNAFDLENNYGVELFRAGDLTDAAIHFQRSTELAPNWWTNWSNLGAIEERRNNLTQAKKDYQKAIANGGYYLAYENLANIYFKENPREARDFCKKSLNALPLNSRLWFILSLSDYKLGKKDEALLAARQAYILSPTQETYTLYTTLEQGQPLNLP